MKIPIISTTKVDACVLVFKPLEMKFFVLSAILAGLFFGTSSVCGAISYISKNVNNYLVVDVNGVMSLKPNGRLLSTDHPLVLTADGKIQVYDKDIYVRVNLRQVVFGKVNVRKGIQITVDKKLGFRTSKRVAYFMNCNSGVCMWDTRGKSTGWGVTTIAPTFAADIDSSEDQVRGAFSAKRHLKHGNGLDEIDIDDGKRHDAPTDLDKQHAEHGKGYKVQCTPSASTNLFARILAFLGEIPNNTFSFAVIALAIYLMYRAILAATA
jgi:hypothetical protein